MGRLRAKDTGCGAPYGLFRAVPYGFGHMNPFPDTPLYPEWDLRYHCNIAET